MQMPLSRVVVLSVLAASVLGLSACFKSTPQVIPTGTQTVSGIVKSAGLSLKRRGTHLLTQRGISLYYLESAKVNLREFEGRNVEVEGSVEYNIDPSDLPVLVVDEIVGAASPTRTWKVTGLGVSLDVPRDWEGKVEGDTAVFTGSGSNEPILTVFLEGESRLAAASSAAGADIRVTPLQLGIRKGIRLSNVQTGRERVEIDLRPIVKDPDADVLTLLFSPANAGQDLDAWESTKVEIIRSLVFASDASSSSSSSRSGASSSAFPVTGSGAGMPCGGLAGILCSQGFYCNITDATANSGLCRKRGT